MFTVEYLTARCQDEPKLPLRPGGFQMIPDWRLLVLCMLSTAAQAQWLNYPTPGTPRTPDGKPNLAAPAPRADNGKPDLSGVWHVHPTSLAEMKRLFGNNVGVTSVPGMEADTIS